MIKFLIFPLWFCKILKPIEYRIDKQYGEGYYGHWNDISIYILPDKLPEE